jgi:integrase
MRDSDQMKAWRLDRRVNNVRNNDPSLRELLTEEDAHETPQNPKDSKSRSIVLNTTKGGDWESLRIAQVRTLRSQNICTEKQTSKQTEPPRKIVSSLLGTARYGWLKEFVIHSMRHTCLTRHGEAGADAVTIMKLAGHSSVTVSQCYVHPTPEAVKRAFDRLETLNRLALEAPKSKMPPQKSPHHAGMLP